MTAPRDMREGRVGGGGGGSIPPKYPPLSVYTIAHRKDHQFLYVRFHSCTVDLKKKTQKLCESERIVSIEMLCVIFF